MSPTRLENQGEGSLMLGDLGLAFLSEIPRRSNPMAKGTETQVTSEKGQRPLVALKISHGSGGWDTLHHPHAPRTRNGHELGPEGENQNPVALKGRGRSTKPQSRQDDQDP